MLNSCFHSLLLLSYVFYFKNTSSSEKQQERKEHRYKGSKMVINKYLSISSNVNVLNVPIKRHSVAELIMKHILPTRDPPQNKRPAQTENEGMEKNIPSKWIGKKKPG